MSMITLPCVNCDIQCPEECAICRDIDIAETILKDNPSLMERLTELLDHKNA